MANRNTGLYVSSRSVFVLSQMYMPKRVAKIFGRTNNGHTPLAAILLCSVFGFLSLTGLSNQAYSQVCIASLLVISMLFKAKLFCGSHAKQCRNSIPGLWLVSTSVNALPF